MIYIHPTHVVPYIMIYLPFPSQTNLANDLGEYVWCWMGTDPKPATVISPIIRN